MFRNSKAPLLLAVALLCLSLNVSGQRPSLASLIDQTSCIDTTCMGMYARSIGFGAKDMGANDNALWFSCEHVRSGAMDMLNVTGLMFFGDGNGRGYAIQTCDAAYVQELTDELEKLNFKVSRPLPTGAIYTSRKFKGLELMCTGKTIPLNGNKATSWAFMVLVK